MPCGHKGFCGGCAGKLRMCPICLKPITCRLKIFDVTTGGESSSAELVASTTAARNREPKNKDRPGPPLSSPCVSCAAVAKPGSLLYRVVTRGSASARNMDTCSICQKLVEDRLLVLGVQPRYGPSATTTTCVICRSHEADVALAPCGHKGFCNGCAHKLYRCSICGEPIKKQLRVYDVE